MKFISCPETRPVVGQSSISRTNYFKNVFEQKTQVRQSFSAQVLDKIVFYDVIMTLYWRFNVIWFDSFTFIIKLNLSTFENSWQEHFRWQTCSVSDSSRLRKFVIEHVKVILNVYEVKQPSNIFQISVHIMMNFIRSFSSESTFEKFRAISEIEWFLRIFFHILRIVFEYLIYMTWFTRSVDLWFDILPQLFFATVILSHKHDFNFA